MTTQNAGRYTAFAGDCIVARGMLVDVALAVKSATADAKPALVFNDTTGAVVDLDLRGSAADISARLAASADRQGSDVGPSHRDAGSETRGRGRPRLGVVAREVTLLPRQWDWLASQPGGASQALRRLVDDARRSTTGQDRMRMAREAAYRFMSAIAGDLPGFEEAARALFADGEQRFRELVQSWPADIGTYTLRLAEQAFSTQTA
ncbi:DUF2239 family protein [Mesorhizobium sp. B2-3-4]|uniref:DUF2239 family protein n=1 Tax=Mesorhizobium sp. B2-3-4 TaxID=2589959 RepID=UPI00112680E5|nr:DUF2239 family protein [Mesorhizobium sp. B2-3-4]TPM28748.1 DUF2239 family protein [Mesorhizobium sp. B2-3-4]